MLPNTSERIRSTYDNSVVLKRCIFLGLGLVTLPLLLKYGVEYGDSDHDQTFFRPLDVSTIELNGTIMRGVNYETFMKKRTFSY